MKLIAKFRTLSIESPQGDSAGIIEYLRGFYFALGITHTRQQTGM